MERDTSLEEELRARCPHLFHGDAPVCGFECPPGWVAIVRSLAISIEAEIAWMPERDRAGYCVTQVKEKFGGLRFYMSKQTEPMKKLIAAAEEQADVTCERCGALGTLRQGKWWLTLCDEHQAARGAT